MKFTKRSLEGYLLIDHSALLGGVKTEMPMLTCNHCQKQLVVNPMRTRDRAYCPGCDHYVCDECEVIRRIEGCKTYKQKMDEFEESVIKKQLII